MTIDYLRENNLIAYEYIRGSHAYGTFTETSDKDIGGVFICPETDLYGLRDKYVEQVNDEKSDVVFYELGRWVELLLKSNPTSMESLFIPDDCIIGDIHPAVRHILNHKEAFLTKQCLNPILGYAFQQLQKASGYNKKCNIPEDFQRKDILDFCYTFKNQGSQPIKEFLDEYHLDQRYCGLVNIPNMKDTYGVYYDFAAYFNFEGIDWYCADFQIEGVKYPFCRIIGEGMDRQFIIDRIKNKEFFGYSGIVYPDEITKSNEVRLSSIPKGELPICYMVYNKDAYTKHCKDYKDWTEWKKHRNPVRYENNRGYNYDSKNFLHMIRLMEMGVELAEGKGFNVRRTGDDVKHLLAIRNHEFSYDEVMAEATSLKNKFDEAVKTTKLPSEIDVDFVNNLLLEARKIAYKK